MANDKKFIVKNGLQTEENVVIGSSTDNGADRLQVTGSSKLTGKAEITQAVQATPSLKVENSGGPSAEIAEFAGTSQSIKIINDTFGDYRIVNTGQNNGLKLYDNTVGVEILYNGVVDMDFNSIGIDFKREPTYNGSVFWNAGNDGAGSGLDADVLDGLDSLQFVRADEDDTLDGNYIITGNLTVQGTRTEVQSETILFADNLLTLNSNFTAGAPTENAGWEVLRGDEASSSLQWDETADWFKLISDGVDLGRIITTADEGSGNNFDADTVDGLEASQFLRSDADDVATGNITVEGNLTVGDGNGTAFLYMDGAGNNGTLASTVGEIGFLNTSFNYAFKVDAAGDVIVTDDIYAQKFIDINDSTYEVIPSSVSTLNNIDLAGALRRDGDVTTLIDFPNDSEIGFDIAGNQLGLMSATSFQYVGDVIADKLIDRTDNTYQVIPSGTSVMESIGIDSAIFHNGDINTKISFGTDTIALETGGAARLTASDTAVTSSVDIIAPRMLDADDNTKFIDPAGLSQLHSANFYSGATTNDVNIGRNVNERFNVNVTDGQGYIRYYQDETNGTDHSVNFEIVSTSIGLNRFNFNRPINAGSNTITAAFGVFTSGAYAPIYYDYNDETYYADFNNTGVSIKAAGQMLTGNGTAALPSFSFTSDPNTGMYRGAADRVSFSAGGNNELNVYTTYVEAPGSFRAPIFYDSTNPAYYLHPNGDSQLNTIDIDDFIRHRGDTNTYFGFGANDTFRVWTNAVQRLNIDNDSADFSVDVYAPRLIDSGNNTYLVDPAGSSVMGDIGIDDYIKHNGNNTAYFGFNANNAFGIWANDVKQVNIDVDSADFTQNVYAPRFYTNDYLTHNGDTNTYVGFDAADQFGIWTAGGKRANFASSLISLNQDTNITGSITATGRGYIGNSLTRPDSLADLSDSALKVGGSDVHLHIASLSSVGGYSVAMQSGRESDNANFELALNPNGGYVGVGLLNPTSPLSVRQEATMGNNPFAATNRLMDFGDTSTDFRFAGDASGNAYLVTDNNFVVYDESASGKFAVLSSGDVIVNNDSVTYTVSDATPAIGTIANNKLHVSGSLSLAGDNDAIVLGNGTSSYFKNNDLGFGQGGGFYMDDTATIKVRNNKAIYTTGNITGGRFYDGSDANYYLDPAGDSQLNTIDIDDYIRHRGDTNTYIGFSANDTVKIFTGGAQRVNIDNDSANFAQNVYAPAYYDSNTPTYYGDFAGTSVMNDINIDDWIRHNGNVDAYFGFAGNNNFKLFTNGTERFNVDANSADFSVNVYAPRYYDSNDNFYYTDPASTSRMNGITFGAPGTNGVKGRYLSIEGNADASGEGSSRIFFAEHNSTTAAMDRYGMSLAYRGGSASVTSASGQPVTLNGVTNGEWALIGHDNSVNGNWAMRGPRSGNTVEARGSFRAPIFYDSADPAYYGDFASTSIMNVVRANQFQVDVAGRYIDSPSGTYGTIKVEGDTNGWAGYAIRDDWVFMSNGATNMGLYNDTRNEWSLYAQDNNFTRLYSNGVHQIGAENGYGYAPVSMRSPIFYDHDNPAYFGNFADRSKFNTLELGNQGNLTGSTSYPLGIHHNNRYLAGIRNSGAGASYPWLVHDNYNFNQVGSVDAFIIHFNGIGDRLHLTEQGNMLITGEMAASNYNLNAGNENISLNPAYGVGKTELKLFDGAKYWEKRAIQALQGNELAPTGTTGEYVKSTDSPAPSSYVLRTAAYRNFYSDMIEVEPGEEVYGEMYVKTISGSGGLFYYGIERFDKDKKPIAGNTGTTYFVGGGNNVTSTSWQKFSGYSTIPTTHTAYSGSDGQACRYVRMRVLMNYSTGGALREFTPPILMRTKVPSRIRTDEAVFSPIYYDSNDVNYYLDPASTSKLNVVDASTFRDRDNTAYFMNPLSGGKVAGAWDWTNGSINNLNNLTFNDPGASEGIKWNGGNSWQIYESPDAQTNAGGNLQFTSGTGNGTRRLTLNTSGDAIAGRYMDATRFRDKDNVAYYLDPASTSILNEVRVNDYFRHNGDTDTYLRFPAADDMQLVAGGRQMIRMSEGTNPDRLRFVTDTNWTDSSGNWAMSGNITVSGIGYANASFRSPIFYDLDDPAYYGDFASTSRMNVINANMYSLNDGWDIYDDDSDTLSIRSNNSDHGEIIFRDSNSTATGRIYFDDDSHWGFRTGIENEWSIYMERNARTILYYNGSQQARTQNGYFEANNDMRSPIFRDSNDPANFYGDFASTSRLRGLTTLDVITTPGVTGYAGALLRRDNRTIEPNDDPAGQLKFGFGSWNNNGSGPYADYLHLRSYTDSSGGSDNLLMFKKSGRGMRLYQQSWNSGSVYSAYSDLAIYNASPGGGAAASFYASVFIDSDDSAYRLDPNSNSRIKHLKVSASTANARYDFAALEVRELNYAGAQAANETIAPRIGFHWGGRVASQIMLQTNGEIQIRNNPGTGYENFRAQIGYFQGEVRAPRYYDSNNPAYYGDFASTSITNIIDNRGEIYNDGWFRNDTSGRGLYNTATAMHWYSTANNAWRAYSTSNTSRIDMHTSGNNRRGAFYANNSNEVGILSQDDGWALQTTNAKVDSHHNFYAPIMYDRNNPAYYVDPNGTSNLYTVNINAQSAMATQKAWVATNYGHGVYGVYSASRYQHVWSMGTSYNLPANGSDTSGAAGNLYGLAWSYNPGYGGASNNIQSKTGLNHQLLLMMNGTTYFAAGNGMWTSGISTSTNSHRAPIFYDTNNTAYYFDGASINSTRFEGVSSRTKAHMALSGQTRSSAEYYMARPRITSDTNYWTGSMGWGTQDFNTVANWGSGFIDTWSNPGNQPSGTSHWVGTQAYHYSNGSSRYGWQMVGGPIENLRFRSTWGGFRAWRTIPVLGVNNGNGAAIYASSFIDSNNTGFYCDPSSGTNLNGNLRATEIYTRSWLRNDNARTGQYNQATGAHSYSYQNQYWAITGNNNSSSMSLQLRSTFNGTMCRWMYGDRTWSGDLNAAGQWQFQTRHTDGYSPSLRFIESGNESWTGNIGNDAGKIEYHSNRFYIEAGGNSNRICQFRRNGSDRSYVDNNGLYVGTATSARWADLAERYTADAIYENATVLGVNLDGDSEATLWQPGMPLLGVISTNPAVQMNDMGIEPGSTSVKAKMNPFIALKGRIPCLVSQPVKKGQWVIPDVDGKAKGVDYGTSGINSYEIIGIALSDSENGEVEVKV